MCAFSQEHTLLKQLFQQNWIDDCGKKGTNKKNKKKNGQNEMVTEKTTTLSSQAENANMRLHLAKAYSCKKTQCYKITEEVEEQKCAPKK